MVLDGMRAIAACAARMLRGRRGQAQFACGKGVALLRRAQKAQGATEYLLVLATAAIVVVVVLAMVNGMRAAAPTAVVVNGTSQTLSDAIRRQFANMTEIVSP